VTGASKKSRGGKGTSSKQSKTSKPRASTLTVVEVDAAPPTQEEPKVAVPEVPAFSSHEWLAVSNISLGYKPWIVRAALDGQPETRKYTEYEIRGLIQRKLSEPA